MRAPRYWNARSSFSTGARNAAIRGQAAAPSALARWRLILTSFRISANTAAGRFGLSCESHSRNVRKDRTVTLTLHDPGQLPIRHGISRFAKPYSEVTVEVERGNWCGCLVAPWAMEYALADSPAAPPLADGIRLRLRRPTWIQCATCSGKSVAPLQTVLLT